MNARVDIIIPIYNVKPYLRRCLDSILAQTSNCWRAVCVDDGSTDGSADIIEEYLKRDSRFMIVRKPNGGLSDARNAGLDAADAEFVMFVDSDDFIHPQTVELALAFADRDGSDVVSWYRFTPYRNVQCRIRRWFGLDTIDNRPWRFSRRYSLDSTKSLVTDNLLSHCYDWGHPRDEFAVKHCHVWKHLLRRSLIDDVRFIKGLNFEDVPWWSLVLLKQFKATITQLPLYYYYLNTKSIATATSNVPKTIYLFQGLECAFDAYSEKGSEEQMSLWSHNIKWAVLDRQASRVRRVMKSSENAGLREIMLRLESKGFFADAAGRKEISIRRTLLESLGL